MAFACASVSMPIFTAFALTLAESIPAPSSPTEMMVWLPWWKARMVMIPTGGLPTACLSSGVSIP